MLAFKQQFDYIQCVSLLGLNTRVKDVHWHFRINLQLSYCFVWHYQTVTLAKTWLKATIS